MMLSPRVSLVNFVVDGIRATLSREDVKDLKRKYPSAQISPLRCKGRSRINTAPSAVRIIPASEYMASV